MNRLQKLESLIQEWLRPLPHLPDNVRKWLANNIWWMVLVAAFGSAIATLMVLGGIFAYMNFIGNASSYAGFYMTAAYSAGWIWTAIVGLLFLAFATVLYSKAVTPLKEHRGLGWRMLFILLLVAAVKVLLDAVLTFSFFAFIFGIIFGVVGLAISAYFLFEIRSYFVKSTRHLHAKK